MTAALASSRIQQISPKYWTHLIEDDLALLTQKMRQDARFGDEMLDAAIGAIMQAGGKRLRPSMSFLVGRIFNAPVQYLVSIGAAVEMLHTATLVHDDLIDGADSRRGVPTLHSQLPTGITVLTGDFIFAKAAAAAAEANNVRVVQLFAETLVRICQGEILQARTRWQLSDFDVYIERIYGKTAALFEAASTSAAILGAATEEQIDAMASFGRDLGLAFQIMDDALDFVSTTKTLGKPAGNDMQQGIFNLPAIYFAERNDINQDEFVAMVEEDSEAVLRDIQNTSVIDESLSVARDYAQKAIEQLDMLPDTVYTEALEAIARYAVARKY